MRRPSAPLIVSSLALLVATGGTSYAAMEYGSRDIKDDSLRSIDIKDDTVRSRDVRDDSLRAKDFREGSLPAGERGPQGETGPEGPEGPAGVGRWLLVDASGAIVAQSGGFEIVAAYPTLPNTAAEGSPSNAQRANGNVYIDANEDLGDNGIVATIALQNTVDQNGDGVTSGRAPGPDANPEFSGEISVSQCNFTGASGIPTNCAPAGAQNSESFVVSPRNSDGSFTEDGKRKRFYVIISGDSSDRS
ncbi:MAG: hypothetical protein AVDCRST_MAG47-2943 [uncultured Nocardioidaceae bacterium]|uniref:Phage tail fiber protein n=1 Tax=uncultured Nocardioidaceae bacterium TaxID=253824 RepID=A0A6J4NRR2_9ACTN|nr:MAG: hypothetical protein AVDCRST_MAG47-2943 [uncultured Nocardioidaceae bacterium]